MAKGMHECWYCGDHRGGVEPWYVDEKTAEGARQMCKLHSATTRAALALRKHGEDKLATELDSEIGIETRPEFGRWLDPQAKSPGG